MIDMLFDQFREIARYWASVEIDEHSKKYIEENLEGNEAFYRCRGVIFGVLSMLDGCSDLPAFHLVPDPSSLDEQYCKERNENFWPTPPESTDDYSINAEYMLHESLGKRW